jgi:hypothetical protein
MKPPGYEADHSYHSPAEVRNVRRSAILVPFMILCLCTGRISLGSYLVLKKPRLIMGYGAISEEREREERGANEKFVPYSKAAIDVTNYKLRL